MNLGIIILLNALTQCNSVTPLLELEAEQKLVPEVEKLEEFIQERITNSISASRRSVQNVPAMEESLMHPQAESGGRKHAKIVKESNDLKEKFVFINIIKLLYFHS